MSDNSAFGFGKFVPGFDFLQSLAKTASQPSTAGSAIPGMSNWVAPTLSVEELDKRIQELKAVQFWLEQNGTALKATIQALEVQKMTLSTLQGMNVNMAELAKAFTARPPEGQASASTPQPAPASAPAEPTPDTTTPPSGPAAEPEAKATPKARRKAPVQADKPASGAAVDPVQWWGALTQQFQNIASAAMQDVAAQAMKAQETSAAAAPQAKAKPAGKAPAKKAPARKAAAKKTRPSRA
jgi:hypothetical protein